MTKLITKLNIAKTTKKLKKTMIKTAWTKKMKIFENNIDTLKSKFSKTITTKKTIFFKFFEFFFIKIKFNFKKKLTKH